MNTKGQVAFESLFILLVILTAAIAITSLYLQSHDDTIALINTREEVLSQINEKKESITIDYITIQNNGGQTTIKIKTTPQIQLRTDEIINKIIESTKYKNVQILIE